MKKTGFARRALALLLVAVMALQLVPASVFAAYGDLIVADPGIKPETLNQDSSINWPIKVYDYLNDGMLFEFNDSTATGTLGNNGASFDKDTNITPYGGGAMNVLTELGEDFTYEDSPSWSTVLDAYTGYGTCYSRSWVDAQDFRSPGFVRVKDGSGVNTYFPATVFGSATNSLKGNIRYMVIAYRASGLPASNNFSVSMAQNDAGTGYWHNGNSKLTMKNSSSWTYMVVDLGNGNWGTSNVIGWTFFCWYTTAGGSTCGLPSGAQVDITHVGYFADRAAAENYGKAAVEFDNDPGEYLHHSTSLKTDQTTTLPDNASLDGDHRLWHPLSLNYWWHTAGSGYTNCINASTEGNTTGNTVRYGMDFSGFGLTREGYALDGFATKTYGVWSSATESDYVIGYSDFYSMGILNAQKLTQSNGATYTRITATNGTNRRFLLADLREDRGPTDSPTIGSTQWLAIVYRPVNVTTSNNKLALWASGKRNDGNDYVYGMASYGTTWTNQSYLTAQGLTFNTSGGWQVLVTNIKTTIGKGDTETVDDTKGLSRLACAGIYLQSGVSLDIAAVAFYGSEAGAKDYATRMISYMNAPGKTTTAANKNVSWGANRHWNTGNNKGFGLLRATCGGNWQYPGGEGGTNGTDEYGYRTWYIGYNLGAGSGSASNTSRRDPMNPNNSYGANYTDSSGNLQANATGTSNYIYHFNTYNTGKMDTDILQFDGYELLQTIADGGVMTAGLLEGSLRTVAVNGTKYRVPVYRQETVEYIAYLLAHALVIPQRDANGNYNTNYINGGKSSLFKMDLNGDGQYTKINLDADSRTGTYTGNTCDGKETDENCLTLAQALRGCLGIKFTVGQNVGSYKNSYAETLGTYAATIQKDTDLIGSFQDVKGNITTAMDAAYFLLNSIFVGNSYNQPQDTYYYLNMPSAEVASTGSGHEGKIAYVFDGGFSTNVSGAVGSTITAANAANNKNGIVYDKETGTIKLHADTNGKTHFVYQYYLGDDGIYHSTATTRFPFLPATDAEGDFAGGTYPVNPFDTDVRNYTNGSDGFFNPDPTGGYNDVRRNYNFAMVSNGEFVFNQEDGLFFEFEGDDDVYLFINGELVMDIGGGHGITGVYFDVNDYVMKARNTMAALIPHGYANDMPIAEADDLIDELAAEGKIAAGDVAKYKRYNRLDLTDGQICQFDFYYMERHSWGSNMRIVTNMHITDPALDVEKTAYQFGERIEYGGVIDPTSSVEYNFSLTNAGNTKLYNLTFKDDVIGVTLDPTNGLTIGTYTPSGGSTPMTRNGTYVLDANGGTLEPMDLTAVVSGTNAEGQPTRIEITFPEVNGDKGLQSLKNFLHNLAAEGTESGYDDAETTHAGSGLWVDGTVVFEGIYYMLTPDQVKARTVNNIVHVTATTRGDPTIVGCRTLTSSAEHRIYTTGFPVHYQWAGHNIFMNMTNVLAESVKEAYKQDTQLSLYQQFFKDNQDINNIKFATCDRYGRVQTNPYVTKLGTNEKINGNPGFLINYVDPGIHTFYVLMYESQYGDDITYAPSEIEDGDYAILRSQAYVADVADSIFVLDYGLTTETMDVGGELFKNDYLFGSNGNVQAKLMGVTGTQPTFEDPASYKGKTTSKSLSSIVFEAMDLDVTNVVKTEDGSYKVNLAIPSTGKEIAYDAVKGEYTLTGVGTSKVIVDLTNVATVWGTTPNLYYWYDDGTPGPSWPGTKMTSLGINRYELEIPANSANIIINNGSSALQTTDLHITPGMESTIIIQESTVTDAGKTRYEAIVETVVEDVTLHAKVPGTWTSYKVEYKDENGAWQEATINGNIADGYTPYNIPGSTTNARVVNNADGTAVEVSFYNGRRVWVEVRTDEAAQTGYSTKVLYTLDTYVVKANVPADWGEDIYLYTWHSGLGSDMAKWPGVKMTRNEQGWYVYDQVPADVTNVIINNGKDLTDGGKQTTDLVIEAGLETWVTVRSDTVQDDGATKYTANIAYGAESNLPGLTFTPDKFMSSDKNNVWLGITVHSTSATPTLLNNQSINIHNEVQMYKKITVLPATVVYYEDGFSAIKPNLNSGNHIEHYGEGSGRLNQSIDQSQIYGQDSVYQDPSNSQYSGNSLLKVEIKNPDPIFGFTFTGVGLEIVGRTNAVDAASTVVKIYDSEAYAAYQAELAAGNTAAKKPAPLKNHPVITQFDQGNDGGAESIEQVPIIRIPDISGNGTVGSYAVEISGIPVYDFCRGEVKGAASNGAMVYTCSGCDKTWTVKDHENGTAHSFKYGKCTVCGAEQAPSVHYGPKVVSGEDQTVPTYLYLDGIRVFQPLGASHEAYLPVENGAQIVELRDLIATGNAAVATLTGDKLSVSSGTTTWTENLTTGEFAPGDVTSYVGNKVDSADDYLISGPNNEVYMEGSATNSALAFYVKKNEGVRVAELQIAARALNYAGFYGAGTSKLAVQLQYGVETAEGVYAWKNLTQIVSGTEQYYSIPYTECPEDASGRYQVVIRAVNVEDETPAMVAYTNVKINGLTIQKVDGVGQDSILYYLNGMLIRPEYYLLGNINGVEYTQEMIDADPKEYKHLLFNDKGVLDITLDSAISGLKIYRKMVGKNNVSDFSARDGLTAAGEATFWVTRPSASLTNLDWCIHKWDAGVVTREPNCTTPGIKTYTCNEFTVDGQDDGVTKCGCTKTETIPTNGKHSYSGGVCVHCQTQEPAFYMVGYINGANHGCEEDYANLGNYLFVDGKLTVTFEKDSFIFLKSGDNTKWYMFENYLDGSNTSGTLYCDKGYKEKMYAPAGAELNFTLVQNEDGSLTLSYTITCQHVWDEGKVETPATCVDRGVMTYTCTKPDCGATKQEPIAATGNHSYVYGMCSVCGAIDEENYRAIYVYNSKGWTTVNAYAFDGSDTALNGSWPGRAMTLLDEEQGLYITAIDKNATTIIFNNGSEQTANLTIPSDANAYHIGANSWSVLGVVDYYLVGTINGTDVGINNDSGNMGPYKFEDGSLTIDLNSDSYLQIKRNDGKLFVTDGWLGESVTEGTFYDADTITTDNKLFASAGSVTLTLTVNANGTLTLKVESCKHSWKDPVPVKDATCSENGSQTVECAECGFVKTEVINATGHKFVNGVCENCGKAENDSQFVLYFRSTAGWVDPNIWAWGDGNINYSSIQTNGKWPGDTMQLVDGTTDIYRYVLSDLAKKVIFSKDGTQTVDLTIPTDGKNMFVLGEKSGDQYTGEWITYDPAAAASIATVSEELTDEQTPAMVMITDEGAVSEITSVTRLEEYALNLESIRDQMNTELVIGENDGDIDTSIPGGNDTETTDGLTIKPQGAGLAFKDEIYYNVFFTVSNPAGIDIEEMGLITWTYALDGTVENAQNRVTDLTGDGDQYKLRTQPISAKNMAEELYFKIYLKLADGSYVYSDLLNYSAKTYCANMLANENADPSLKALCVALMNYGAEAQKLFGYKTDALMNADLTAAQQALVEGYSADMIRDVEAVDGNKVGSLSANGGFSSKYPGVSFGGAFGINYLFTPEYEVEGEMKLYIWTAEDYANAEVLTLENASQVMTMTDSGSGVYTGRCGGIAAKNVGDTVYACGVYEADGTTYCTGILAYSVGAYCENMAAGSSTAKALAAATGVYAYYARLFLLGE